MLQSNRSNKETHWMKKDTTTTDQSYQLMSWFSNLRTFILSYSPLVFPCFIFYFIILILYLFIYFSLLICSSSFSILPMEFWFKNPFTIQLALPLQHTMLATSEEITYTHLLYRCVPRLYSTENTLTHQFNHTNCQFNQIIFFFYFVTSIFIFFSKFIFMPNIFLVFF